MVTKIGQLKIRINDELLLKFKRIVLAKHGKLKVSREGEEAIKMYVQKNEHLLKEKEELKEDSLKEIIGIAQSTRPRNALEDLKKLDTGDF